MTHVRLSRALVCLLPLLLAAASCPSVEEETLPLLEASYRRMQGGRIEEGIAGFDKAAGRLLHLDEEERPIWVRPFILTTLHRPGVWSRMAKKTTGEAASYANLAGFLGYRGPEDRLPEAARASLVEARFHDQPGRWSRIPAWALPELLRLCGNSLMRKALATDPPMPPPDDVPPQVADPITRAALARAASQFMLRAWEVAVEQKTWERDGRIDYRGVVQAMAGFQRDIAGAATDPDARARRLDEARLWDTRATAAQENVPLQSLKAASDVEFVRATVRDHFEDGVKAYGVAVEELSGRGTRELAEEHYRRCIEHLLVAREFKASLTKEEQARMEFASRAVKGLRRLMSTP